MVLHKRICVADPSCWDWN